MWINLAAQVCNVTTYNQEHITEKERLTLLWGIKNEGLKSSGYYSKFLLMIQVLLEQIDTLVVLTLNSPLKVDACISTPIL